jgi:hypothetical protein
MSALPDEVRAVVVKLDDTERPWIAACMSLGTWDVIGEEDWQAWRSKALDLVLSDWQSYEVREVVLTVPQDQLDALFAVRAIDAEAKS